MNLGRNGCIIIYTQTQNAEGQETVMLKELAEYLVKAIVDYPDQVQINELESARSTVLELKVAPEDIGHVIGKGGRMINAIRTILNGAAAKIGKRATLELVD